MTLTKTSQEVSLFGITIPKGYPVEESKDSCACVARYGAGCSFTPKKGDQYMRPKAGFPIAVGRGLCE